ncbi:MAG: hypothetical protein AAF919_16870 [Pseudomonadota bacterium]
MNHIFRAVGRGPLGRAPVVAEVERLVNTLMRNGTRRADMTAAICGGAHLFKRGRDHGAAIADACLGYLSTEEIPIIQASTGGHRARLVRFCPYDGTVMVSHPGDTFTGDLRQFGTRHDNVPDRTELF